MMIKFCVLLTVVALAGFTVSAEDCVAQAVEILRISANSTLSWSISETEVCSIDLFQVDVVGDRSDEYHFKVLNTYVDLSFLNICEEWKFTVTPYSDGVAGFERHLTDHIPLPPTADISLRYFNVTQVNERDVFVRWALTNYTHGDCTLRYRITVEDEELGDIRDIYVTGNTAHLINLSPCITYNLGIRAVNRAHPTIEGPLRHHSIEMPPAAEDPPRLTSIEVGTTTVDMTWRLENTGRNRCPIRTLYIDGDRYFNITVPLTDTLERPPVEVNLRGLQSNSMYLLKVSVENSGGISRPTVIGAQTLAITPGQN